MTEYIKKTDAITTTWMILRGMGYAAEDNPDMVKTVSAVFDTAPAADAATVRHGKWERSEGNPYPSCSECGCESLSRADRPYCQFCGAKMDGKSTDYAPAKPYDLLYEEGGPDA